jgi:mannose/cellobiose epimerase-like protein (N-acyl-D-glucosamine 2-epimerase family)
MRIRDGAEEHGALAAVIARAAARLGDDLANRVLPFLSATADRRFGGFLLADADGAWPRPAERLRWLARRWLGREWGATRPSPGEKHVVGQARVAYALALGHRLGFDPSGAALAASLTGIGFLRERLADPRHGGVAWCATRRGRVVRPEKLLYAHALAILALTELGRAAAREDLLAAALAMLRLVQERLHDDTDGGWREYAATDFRELGDDGRAAPGLLATVGCKSANAHVHALEAITELVLATGDGGARSALDEALAMCARFFPADPAAARERLAADWTPIAGAARPTTGHLLEHAWMSVRAQRALGRQAPAAATLAAVDHALREFDWELGGFVSRRADGRMEKDWWVQAEGMVALTTAVRLAGRPEHMRALALLLGWVVDHQRGRRGVWVATTDRAGRVTNPTLAGTWKAGYHEVRAAALVARAFAPAGGRGAASGGAPLATGGRP